MNHLLLLSVFGALVVVFLFSQIGSLISFIRVLRSPRATLLDDESCHEATVVLCLRGNDPFLSKCVNALLNQNYPSYEIRFVLDNENDPARAILVEILSKHPGARYAIQIMQSPSDTCSLKCSGLVQAIERVEPGVFFVAGVDADTIPHPDWLRELATALQPSDVGAATGNRWYAPETGSSGAMIRYFWNAAAVLQMNCHHIPWGGTLAIKTEAIRRAHLLERWKQSLVEDTMVFQHLAEIGQKVVFVPSLLMINREDLAIDAFVPWVRRQLLCTRLYHPKWFAVMLHGLSLASLILWGLLGGGYHLLRGDFLLSVSFLFVLAVFESSLLLMLWFLEEAVRQKVSERGEIISRRDLRIREWFSFLGSMLLTQWIYIQALISCQFTKRIEWRGIRYELDGPWRIRMMGYSPYQEGAKAVPEPRHSL